MKLFEYIVGAVIVAAAVLAVVYKQATADVVLPILRSIW